VLDITTPACLAITATALVSDVLLFPFLASVAAMLAVDSSFLVDPLQVLSIWTDKQERTEHPLMELTHGSLR
jgi:hypothetical protein